jgi:Zn-dependent peptidase ImmA (M78 family)
MAVVRLKPASAPAIDATITSLESLVQKIKAANLYRIPLDIFAVAELLGITVYTEIMDDEVSGYLEFRGSRWVAGINKLHHKLRQRFTMAHEIAHFVLHKGTAGKFVDETFARRSSSKDKIEREADRFAAELLMPTNSLKQTVDSGTNDLDELAKVYEVSALAMKYRLMSLNYVITEHG